MDANASGQPAARGTLRVGEAFGESEVVARLPVCGKKFGNSAGVLCDLTFAARTPFVVHAATHGEIKSVREGDAPQAMRQHVWEHPCTLFLRPAAAALLVRIAAAARNTAAMRARIAQLRGGGLATALAGFASAAAAGAAIVHYVVHRKLLVVGRVRRTSAVRGAHCVGARPAGIERTGRVP